ncbi:hypothetical protein ABZ892_18515 [Streptomyces sp. NPDC046924]|uniref:hypothetical protein n=1 Tax=Streptomyces sp. NPDC046924 TaxID=3155136 RepID=UPI0033E896D2
MRTGVKITAFAVALAATFGTAYGVGRVLDPVVADSAPAPAHDGKNAPASPAPGEGAGHGR